MSVLVVIQARTGSSRFPGKVLAELAGQTMLGFMLDRIASLPDDPGTDLLVATTDSQADDEVVAIAGSKDITAVRGNEQDVLGRFCLALTQHPADTVVRLTADCPLMDPTVVRAALAEHRAVGADYTSNTLARTFPDGLDVEVVAADALRWANEHAHLGDEREHVTPHLQRHPRRFQIAQLVDDAQAGDERWTVDRPDDLDIIRAAVDAAEDPLAIGWRDLLDRLGRRARIAEATAKPTAATPHRRGEAYHREWTVEDPSGTIGSALVVVDEGGASSLELRGSRPKTIEAAVREHLRADLQVTQLTMTTGAAT